MRKLFGFLSAIALLSCNPYEQYSATHLYIQAEVEPGSARIAANVQMVFVARKEYTDSICFRLNPGLKIQSIAAQELQKYRFNENGDGKLVLYIEEQISPGDALQISLSYSGQLGPNEIQRLDSSLYWYPMNENTRPCTYQAKFAVPGKWRITDPGSSTGKHGKWLVESRDVRESLSITFQRNNPSL